MLVTLATKLKAKVIYCCQFSADYTIGRSNNALDLFLASVTSNQSYSPNLKMESVISNENMCSRHKHVG